MDMVEITHRVAGNGARHFSKLRGKRITLPHTAY